MMLHLILYGPFWLGLEPYDYGCMCFATLSFLAGTRNLMMYDMRPRKHCAIR